MRASRTHGAAARRCVGSARFGRPWASTGTRPRRRSSSPPERRGTKRRALCAGGRLRCLVTTPPEEQIPSGFLSASQERLHRRRRTWISSSSIRPDDRVESPKAKEQTMENTMRKPMRWAVVTAVSLGLLGGAYGIADAATGEEHSNECGRSRVGANDAVRWTTERRDAVGRRHARESVGCGAREGSGRHDRPRRDRCRRPRPLRGTHDKRVRRPVTVYVDKEFNVVSIDTNAP